MVLGEGCLSTARPLRMRPRGQHDGDTMPGCRQSVKSFGVCPLLTSLTCYAHAQHPTAPHKALRLPDMGTGLCMLASSLKALAHSVALGSRPRFTHT